MTSSKEIKRIRGLIRRGQRRIRQIVTFNRKRRKRIAALRALAAPRFGIDLAWGTISTGALKDAGVTFVCRYLSHDNSKNLTRAEAAHYAKVGIESVVVWETSAERAKDGRGAGIEDAHAARELAVGCGMPLGRPIYFAVDFEGTGAEVEDYFRGVESILGRAGTGCYGSYRVVAELFDKGLIGFGWQTYAWSNGLWDHRAQLQQYSNGHILAGVGVDYDRSTQVDFGQWMPNHVSRSQ